MKSKTSLKDWRIFLRPFSFLFSLLICYFRNCVASGNCGENKVKKKGFSVQLCLRKAWSLIFANTFFFFFSDWGTSVLLNSEN